MKRALIICMAAVLLSGALGILPAGAENRSFVPDVLVARYNHEVKTFYSILDLEDDAVALAGELSRVAFLSQEDNLVIYANENASITFFFAAPGRDREASFVGVTASLGDDNPVKHYPLIAFVCAFCLLNPDLDAEPFLSWAYFNREDGSFFESDSFSALYSREPGQSVSIVLMNTSP